MTDTQVGSSGDVDSGQPVVLIVDDDKEVADTYALWLEGEYDVRTAYGGHEAIEQLSDDIDIILLDRRMPGMPGDEVLKRVRDRGVDCQVSMLTAVEPDSDLTDLDFEEYLVKPVSKADVTDVVNELLVRESLDEETQEYLALKSSADAIEEHKNGQVRDPEAVERLEERVEEFAESPTVQEETEKIKRFKKLNELIRSVNRTVVEVDSQQELDRRICEEFVEFSPYEWSLRGEYTSTYDEFIPSATSDGATETDSVTCLSDGPITGAVTETEVRVLDADEAPDSPIWDLQDEVAPDRQPASAVVVPVSYREAVSGAMLLWSSDPVDLHERERTMLAEVGQTIGNAADSLQTKEMVHADTLVEVELQVTDRDDVFVDLSATHDCRVHLDGINFSSTDGVTCYLTITTPNCDEVAEFLVQNDGVEHCRVIDERGDDALVECTVADNSVALTLIEASGNVKNLVVDKGTGHVSVEIPPERNVRGLFGAVNDVFADVDFVSKQTVDRSYQSIEGFRGALEEKLTERQNTVIDAAQTAGYFDWPRESTPEEVAEGLGLAPPTFHEHLREANRKLVEVYLDETE